jgi:hypothetical protein
MVNYKRIKKECFWDYKFKDSEIKSLAVSKDPRERVFLFQKILLNSSSMFNDLKIFDLKILNQMINEYKVPDFNRDYIFRKKNMAESYFLGKPLLIRELKWQI